ncbi:MAG TPA: undecaprenyl-diphosphate phosphatase [Thermodesulfobacteriota bacterium]|nr:undecaprenyl-diphosphate phosphatase [Thermodesulfobacteriota bacterium]
MIEAIFLGILQGLTEFLPVSSTAHLILATKLFHLSGMVDTLSFDVALHAGTLIAVVAFFYRDWLEMIFGDHRLLILLIAATIPGGIAGYFLNHFAEKYLRNPVLIAIILILASLVLWLSERSRKRRRLQDLYMSDALLIGAAQAIAILPGVSRSGFTIAMGLFRNMTREAAARFSFLLSTPLIAGAVAMHGFKIIRHPGEFDLSIMAAGVISSALSGFLVIGFLMRFFKKYSLMPFVVYRIILGVVILLLLFLAP